MQQSKFSNLKINRAHKKYSLSAKKSYVRYVKMVIAQVNLKYKMKLISKFELR